VSRIFSIGCGSGLNGANDPQPTAAARTPDLATSKIPKKLRGDLSWILDSARQLEDAKMTSGPPKPS
jgi:hypothetical protein